jgi:nitroreductase
MFEQQMKTTTVSPKAQALVGEIPGWPNSADAFEAIVNARRSVRKFSADAPWDPDSVSRSIDRALRSANSSNLQLWRFYRIQSAEKLREFGPICMNQGAATTAREIVAVVVNQQQWRAHARANYDYILGKTQEPLDPRQKTVKTYYGKLIPNLYWNDWFGLYGLGRKITTALVGQFRPMYRESGKSDVRLSAHRSVALAAQTFMLSMKAEGFDTCPMEGFDSARARKALGLPRHMEFCMLIGCGPGMAEGIYGPRFRVPNGTVVESR